jgi:hypothetical protein
MNTRPGIRRGTSRGLHRGVLPLTFVVLFVTATALAVASSGNTGSFGNPSGHPSTSTGRLSEKTASTRPVPSPTPSLFEVERFQLTRGSKTDIEVEFVNCAQGGFSFADKIFSDELEGQLKPLGITTSNPSVATGRCKATFTIEISATSHFRQQVIPLNFTKGGNPSSADITIELIEEPPTPPGPIPPGMKPDVDIMWTMVPEKIVKDNFGARVGKLFYCIEVVVGNNSGYDLQIASVGFTLGPVGKAASAMNKTYKTVIDEIQKNQKEDLVNVLASIEATCVDKTGKKLEGLELVKCRNANLAEQLGKLNASQQALVGAVKEQADLLTQFSRIPYAQKVPVSSYRMTRGSIEHGQFLSFRNLGLNTIRTFGPILTGFLPFFHVLNHRTNFSEGINILSNPIEKGFELLVPDETITQMQRLDEDMLRDGMIIQNNRQIRTRVFVPKDILKLERGLRDDPMMVTQALGEMYLIGDSIKFINRISVTSTGSGEVLPPPRVTAMDITLTIGGPATLSVTGTFLEGAHFVPDDPTNIKVESESSTRTGAEARLTISEKADVGSHTFLLRTDGGTANVQVTFTQPQPFVTQNIVTFPGGNPKVNDSPGTEYPFTLAGKYFRGAQLSPKGDADKALELVKSQPDVSDGGTKLHGSVRLREGAKKGKYHFDLTNPQNPDKTDVEVDVDDQLIPSVDPSTGIKLLGKVPPAHKKSQVDLLLTGDNLYNANLKLASAVIEGTTVTGDEIQGVTITSVDNKQQKTLTAHIAVDERASAGNYTFSLTNAGGPSTTPIPFTVGPQEDILITKVSPEKLTATGKEQLAKIVFTEGANLLAIKSVTFSTNPADTTKNVSLQGNLKESVHESNGETLTLDVKVPATVKAGDKVVIILQNSNGKPVTREIEVVPPPPPVIEGFVVNGSTVPTASGKIGDTVVIKGKNLKDAKVSLGEKEVTLTDTKDDQITFKVPEGAAGEVTFKIKTPGGDVDSGKFTVTPP